MLPCFQCQRRQWLVFVILYWMGRTCFISVAHVVFPCSIADWIFPTVIGDIPPPMEDFSFTKISSKQAALFGGYSPGSGSNSDLRLATISKDSVVSVMSIAPSLFHSATLCSSLWWLYFLVLVSQCLLENIQRESYCTSALLAMDRCAKISQLLSVIIWC